MAVFWFTSCYFCSTRYSKDEGSRNELLLLGLDSAEILESWKLGNGKTHIVFPRILVSSLSADPNARPTRSRPTEMKIAVRRTEDVAIVDIEGRLVAGVGAEQLRDSMDQLLARREGKVLLNLEKVSRIDSTGVGELVASIKRAERASCQVKLLSIAPQVRHILDLARILPRLDFAEDEAEALEDFHGGPYVSHSD